jgi:Family of unknown function (DUF6247)
VAQARKGCLPAGFRGKVEGVTAQPSDSATPARNRTAKTLDDIVRVMTGDVDDDFRQRFQDALGKAWATARAESSLGPLTSLVEAWWPIARRWSDPVAARAYYADLERVIHDGIPPESRGNVLDAVAQLRARYGQHSAFDKLESLAARW